MECQLPLDLPQKLNCPCCESFPANAFHSRVSQKAQSGEFKYRGGSSLPWNLLNAIKRGLGHRFPWGCFSLGFSNSWIGQSTRLGFKFPPNSQFPYCLELVLLVRASIFNYKEQYRDHDLFAPLILTFMYCPTEHINNKSHFLGVICYCQSAVFQKRIVPITRKNDKFVAKIANTRLTKILWPFLRSPKLPKGCQLTRSLEGKQCLYLEGAIDFNNRAATA